MFRLDDFLGCFFHDHEIVNFRGLPPKGFKGDKVPIYTRSVDRYSVRTNEFIQMDLKEQNQKFGMYFVVNVGGFKDDQITRTTAVFCEIDDRPICEQHALFDASPIPPSVRVETRKSVHAYWLLEKSFSGTQWERIQRGLIDKFKSDAGINNPARLMRLPFFNHLTVAGNDELEKVRCRLHTLESGRRYGFNELISAFPYEEVRLPEVKFDQEFNSETMEGIGCELRYRISQLPSYREKPNGKAEAQGVCHNGQRSKTALFVNLRTGAVHCNGGCDFWKIAASFGLDRPVKQEMRMRPRQQQQTSTAKFLMDHVYGRPEISV